MDFAAMEKSVLLRPVSGRARPWGISSSGRAFRSQRRGREFESPMLHKKTDYFFLACHWQTFLSFHQVLRMFLQSLKK